MYVRVSGIALERDERAVGRKCIDVISGQRLMPVCALTAADRVEWQPMYMAETVYTHIMRACILPESTEAT